jgi:hypothetical protein
MDGCGLRGLLPHNGAQAEHGDPDKSNSDQDLTASEGSDADPD